MKNSLGPKRAIYKNPFDCPQCKVKATTIGDLKVHMKTCHSKPNLESPQRKKSLKLSVSTGPALPMISMGNNEIKRVELNQNNLSMEQLTPEVEDLISCNLCEYDTTDPNDLNKHQRVIHGKEEQQTAENPISLEFQPENRTNDTTNNDSDMLDNHGNNAKSFT